MDEILKSEIIVVLLEKEEGVYFEEFSGLFHQVHGYQLILTNYGYKSLKDLLDGMKDEVELLNVNGQQVIKYRSARQLNVISPCMDTSFQDNDPDMSDTCSAYSNKSCPQTGDIPLDEFPKEGPLCEQNVPGMSCQSFLQTKQSTLPSQVYLANEAYTTKDTRQQMPFKDIVKIISQKIKSHPTGLRAAKLRQYILEQHKIDLELYSQQLGYTDMLSMLKQIPIVKFTNTSGKNVITASFFYKNLSEDQHTPSTKAKPLIAAPSSTSSSTLTGKHSPQPDVSSKMKKTKKEPLPSIASPSQKMKPISSETGTATLPEPGSDHLFTSRENHIQSILSHEHSTPAVVVEVNPSKQKSFHSIQKPSEKIVKIISEKVISSHMGLKPETLTKYVMGQHNIDLELYSQQLGYKDMESMLKQIPGIGFANNSRKNVLITLGSRGKSHNSQPAQPQKEPFSWNKVVDVLRLFPSGFRALNLKKYILNAYNIDLEALSQKLGFTDMPSMLKQVPGITSLNGDVFIASDVYKSTAKPAQVKTIKFSEQALVDFLKAFPSGLKVNNLIKHMKKKNKIDLMKYSQEKGFTDIVGMLKKIPGITVVYTDVIMASDVYKTCQSISKATDKARPAKCPKNNGKTPKGSQTVTKPSTTRTTASGQQIPLPTRQIPSTKPLIKSPQNVQQQGLRPNVSYASACAGNLKKDQKNVQSLQCPPNFNVEKVHAAKAATPKCKEAPKGVLPSSMIRDNLRLLLKSHANGLSIFQLKKLYLFKFKQPFVCKGLSARKLLMTMKDVAKMKGVGVQIKVFPALPEENPSVSAKKYKDCTPQGAAISVAEDGKKNEVLPHLQDSSPLLTRNSTKHLENIVPVCLSKHQPSSSGYSQTELTGGYVPISTSEDITSHKHHDHNQPMTENCGRKLPTPAVSNPENYPSTMGSQFTWVNTSLDPAAIAGNISNAQWPPLPQKFNILKEIEQRAKMSPQLQKNIQHNELCFRQTSTAQPQEEDSSAQNLLQAHQDPYNINRQQEPQILDLEQPIPQPDFSFVMEEVGFSFVKAKTKADKDMQPFKILCTGPPPNTFTDSTQLALGLSGAAAVSNTHATPLQLYQSASCNMASQIKGSAPEANMKSVNVPPEQKTSHFHSQKVTQQTYSHLMTFGTMASLFPMPNRKSNPSQSLQNPTNYYTQNADSLFLEPKRQQATCAFSQTSVQAQGMQPSCAGEQVVPSKQQQEASSPKSICDFEQRGSTPSPSKQAVANLNLNNDCGLAVSPKPQSLEKVPNSQTKVGSHDKRKEQSLTETQTTNNAVQGSSLVSQIQQHVPVIPSTGTDRSPASHTLRKDIDVNIVNSLKTQKKEHSQTRDGVDGVETSAHQNVRNTGNVYTHGQTVTEPFHTQSEVPPPNTTLSVEQSRSSPTTHYNSTGSVPGYEKGLTSQPYQYFSPSLRSDLSGYPVTTFNQQDSSDNSSGESTKTWQEDSNTFCCIL